MPDIIKYSDEIKFCVKYLNEQGIFSSDNLDEIIALCKDLDLDFNIVKVEHSFYTDLAKKLRELWPTGEKDGKYPWRESVFNLSRRLETLWRVRKLKTYTLDSCLTVARRYLAQFKDSTKYMQTLKYFVLKQNKLSNGDGTVKYTYESRFADMLEGKSDEDAIQNEWNELINSASLGEGELI